MQGLVMLIPLKSQQTLHVEPMLIYCWSSVVDGGSTLNKRCFNVLCLLGCHILQIHAQKHHGY